MPPRAATSRGCARPHLIPSKRTSGPRDPLCSAPATPSPMPPPHIAWPLQVSRRPGSSKDHTRGGAVPSGHATRHHPAEEPTAHSLPKGGVVSSPQESCSFSRKAPSPAFPPKHSPASRRSSPRTTRGRTGARPGPEHATWTDWPRSAPAAPNQLVPTGGAVPPPEAPNSLYSRRKGPSSRNFACTTSAAPTGVPARGRTRASH